MKTSKHFLQGALSFTLGLAIVFSATTADAGKRGGDNPFDKRDVIADAAPICDAAAVDGIGDALDPACNLLANSNGPLMESTGCTAASGPSTAVSYSLRNCDKNRDSLMRFAASAVLSLDDWLSPRSKESQMLSAAGYLCGYSDKYLLLEGADKVSGADLDVDAEFIVTEYLFLSCVDI